MDLRDTHALHETKRVGCSLSKRILGARAAAINAAYDDGLSWFETPESFQILMPSERHTSAPLAITRHKLFDSQASSENEELVVAVARQHMYMNMKIILRPNLVSEYTGNQQIKVGYVSYEGLDMISKDSIIDHEELIQNSQEYNFL